MMDSIRSVAAVAVLVASSMTVGCSPGSADSTPTTCTADADCAALGTGARCVDNRCVAATDGGDVPGEVFTCTDRDRDGYGRWCDAGPDCDDTDPARHADCPDCGTTHAPGCACAPLESYPCFDGPAALRGIGVCVEGTRRCRDGQLVDECEGQGLPGAETCNAADDDCDGTTDEGLLGTCGDCDLTCHSDGEIEPTSSDPGTSGLVDDPDGPGVILGSEEVHAGFAWIANQDGTVTKMDLVTGAEVARYRVGLAGDSRDSPSRTAVDGTGNAYVACRAHVDGSWTQGSVTKMAGDARFCVDRNGDTTITTSIDSTPLALGTDECVIWTVTVGGPGGIPRALAIDGGAPDVIEGFPWVGLYNEMRFYKLDPGDGHVLATVDVNGNPYGAAIDSTGWIWVSEPGGPSAPSIQRFHSTTLAVDPPVHAPSCDSAMTYGIAVATTGRPWVARWACRSAQGYDPDAGTWLEVPLSGSADGGRGIAADADGTIWVATHRNDWSGGGGGWLVSFNGADGSSFVERPVGGVIPVGVGIDELGHVWTVNQQSNTATRYTKATGETVQFPTGPTPYTYSDFTGYARRLMIPRGIWTRDYERCDGPTDSWGTVDWDVTAPPGRITINAASAATAAGLAAAPDVTLAEIPDDVPPVSIEDAFEAASVPLYRFLRITVVMEGGTGGTTPVFRSIQVTWHCNLIG